MRTGGFVAKCMPLAVSLAFHALAIGATFTARHSPRKHIKPPEINVVRVELSFAAEDSQNDTVADDTPPMAPLPVKPLIEEEVKPVVRQESKQEPVQEQRPTPVPEKLPLTKPTESTTEAKPTTAKIEAAVTKAIEVAQAQKSEPSSATNHKSQITDDKQPTADSRPPAAGPQMPAPRQAQINAPPAPITAIRPDYPRGARRRGEEGSVELELKIGANGKVNEIKVARSSGFPDLDNAAIKAVEKAKFTPAQSDDGPVPATVRLPLAFRLTP